MKKISFSVMLLMVLFLFSSWTERNILTIWVNSEGKILVEAIVEPLDRVDEIVKEYVLNTDDSECYPEKKERELPYLGIVRISKVVISIQCDRDTKYKDYVAVQNEIEKAYNEMRNDFSMKKFGVPYYLLALDKQKSINMAIPKRISEAEPNYVRNSKGELVENNLYWW